MIKDIRDIIIIISSEGAAGKGAKGIIMDRQNPSTKCNPSHRHRHRLRRSRPVAPIEYEMTQMSKGE